MPLISIAMIIAAVAMTQVSATSKAQHWYAYSKTAESITGDLAIDNGHITMGRHVY